jgi:hypothetical protein
MPETYTKELKEVKFWINDDVIAVETIGDWITLSIPIIAFLFWFFEVNKWELPMPTDVNSKTFGIVFNASEADAETLIWESFSLTTYKLGGSLSVTPIPGTEVVAIPIACDDPIGYEYIISSPVT